MNNSKFEEECLKHHNAFRAKHNAPDLVLDSKLSEFAQEWAVALAAKGSLESRDRSEGDYGENLYTEEIDLGDWIQGAKRAVQSWYDEVSKVEFEEDSKGVPENFQEIKHFSQVVWSASKKLGVGVATSEDGRLFVVCNYAPTGNKPKSDFYKNVGAPPGYVFKRKKKPPAEPKKEEKKPEKPEKPKVEPKPRPEEIVKSLKSLSALQKAASVAVASTKSLKTASSRHTGKSPLLALLDPSIATMWISPSFEERLKSIPPDELRLWSAWLINVSDQAIKEWHEWLLDHIDLYLRINEFLIKAKKDIEKREQRVNFSKIVVAKSASTVASVCPSSAPSTVDRYAAGRAFCDAFARKSETSLMKRRRLGCCRKDDPPEEDEGFTNYSGGFEDEFDEFGEYEYEYETCTETCSSECSEQDLEAIRLKLCEKIPIPANECEMWQLMEEIRRQARRYQLLYEHWIEICLKVQERISGGPFLVQQEDEEGGEADIDSYFGFLRDEMDFEIRYESELGGYINLEGRERITCRHLQLFFNLKDATPVCRDCDV